ncbi:MAG: alanine racemase [Thiotrichales bacterium]|nr:alanine racemase [Thiotrichales bacterium]
MSRPAQVRIHLNSLRHNLSRVRSLVPGSKVMAVIKADAYGHGIERVARTLNDADAFGVACLEEAAAVREAGVSQAIVLLEGPYSGAELASIEAMQIEIVVHDAAQVEMLEGAHCAAPVRVWLKVDTGMHRLGIAPGILDATLQRLRACPAVADEIRLMTHLACANEPGHPMTAQQLGLFSELSRKADCPTSVANSAAILNPPDVPGDWVRPGLMLYGVSPFSGKTGTDHGLQPVMSLHSELIAVRQLRAGDSVGYGASWQCPEDMPIGIVAAGYGDGYPRHAPAGTPVLVDGTRAALVGHASMDMLAVDLRSVPDAGAGAPVVLWGEGLPVEEIAARAGTIPYELLSSVQKRLRFIEHGEG